jgi:hypothetical protein
LPTCPPAKRVSRLQFKAIRLFCKEDGGVELDDFPMQYFEVFMLCSHIALNCDEALQ